MVNYSCDKCGKTFKQKGHYMKHLQRKTPCDNIKDKIEDIVEKKVDELVKEKLQDLVDKGEIEIKNTNLISHNLNSNTKNTEMESKKIKFIDLFCGLGAFHESFKKSEKNYECVFACDINENVRRIYEENHCIKTHGDINKIDIDKDIPNFDILCAGFPCQPFSIAGKKEGFNDKEKGNLFYNILDIVDIKKPNTLILENVKNLLTINDGDTFNIIQSELHKREYHVSYKIIDSKYYNSPQSRQRLLIICSKIKNYEFKNIKNEIIPVSSIIDKGETDYLDYDKKYTLIENKCSNRKNTCNMLFKLINKKTGKGGRQGERVYSPDSCGPTICASSGGPGAKTGLYYINGKVRRLNVEETLQMFGFSKNYKWKDIVNKEEMLFCLGNSIVVNVIDEIIKDL
jgi:DNA (cytosine-5)-methyltransferase 1